MENCVAALRWADLVSEKYLRDCQSWPKDQIVNELERTGYDLARKGRTAEATSIFIAVADLIGLSPMTT